MLSRTPARPLGKVRVECSGEALDRQRNGSDGLVSMGRDVRGHIFDNVLHHSFGQALTGKEKGTTKHCLFHETNSSAVPLSDRSDVLPAKASATKSRFQLLGISDGRGETLRKVFFDQFNPGNEKGLIPLRTRFPAAVSAQGQARSAVPCAVLPVLCF